MNSTILTKRRRLKMSQLKRRKFDEKFKIELVHVVLKWSTKSRNY